MDKTKLLNSLNSRRNSWNECLKSSYESFIRHQEGVKLLTDIIAEVESDREDEMFGIQDILSGMKTYCELFQGKCENCFFNITKQINSDLEDYAICKCAYDMIKRNVIETKNKETL